MTQELPDIEALGKYYKNTFRPSQELLHIFNKPFIYILKMAISCSVPHYFIFCTSIFFKKKATNGIMNTL